MVKYRLFFGTLMTALFAGLAILDGWLDGSLTALTDDDKSVQGTILAILIVVLIIFATLELSRLAAAKNLRLFAVVSIVASSLMATTWYWLQIVPVAWPSWPCFTGWKPGPLQLYLFFLFAFSFLAL